MIPLILGAAALATGVLGIGAGISGLSDMDEAKEIGENAQRDYQDALYYLNAQKEETNQLAEYYGEFQMNVMIDTIRRFIDFIENNIGNTKQSQQKFLEGLDGISVKQINEYKTATIEAEQFFQGGIKAVGGAAAGYGGAMSLATSLGVASTGTAISGLSGAAATNATLAWLGGGSLAAGGGGMALGSLILGGITVGPALMIGGFVFAGEGEKALTKAREYEAEVNKATAEIDAIGDFLEQVRQRIYELGYLLKSLNERATDELDELESLPYFDQNRDESKFQEVALLIKAISEIMKTPVLNSEGQLNPATARIRAKYRSLGDY
ncbi:hypothetical protein [Rivularia sp. UHCC 0363]|uniref:hypothetical protein n=1 Tax=Rivularia sp. UHCC 0363 TaxID=3110244 RepID=UPI002B1F73FE|nr:hypothetical protein [Rivularia sp. UHCC 0363]MEA5597072.1 hypothetical protein [Rivularia sp. UHCC 0363]